MITPHDAYEEYFEAVNSEFECLQLINSILITEYDYKKPDLKKIFDAIEKIKPEIDLQINRQINILIKLMPEYGDIESLSGLIEVFNLPEKVQSSLVNFLKRISPNSTEPDDVRAYYEYINSVFARLVRSKDIRFLAKLEERLPIEGRILIKRTHSDTTIESQKELNAFQYAPLKIDTQILDCVYKHNPKKFNEYAHSESSIYKRGTYNPNKYQIDTLTIKLDDYKKGHLFIGWSKNKKKEKVHFYMAPNFAIIAHEEIHGLRMLRGASRGGEESLLPTVLQLAFDNVEEYFNILIGKSSEALFSQIYKLAIRIGHLGFEFTDEHNLSEQVSSWQEKLLMSMATVALKLPSKMDLRNCNKQILKKLSASGCIFKEAKLDEAVKVEVESNVRATKNNKKLFQFIAALFYGENLDSATIRKMIDKLAKKNLIPRSQNVLHLLAQFSHLWPEDKRHFAVKLAFYCVRKNIPIDQMDDNGLTPFMYAIKNLNFDMIHFFIENHENLSLVSIHKSGTNNALEALVSTGLNDIDTIQHIIGYLNKTSHGTFQKALYVNKKNPLIKCVLEGNINFFRILLDYYDKELITEIKEGNKGIVSILLNKIIEGTIDDQFFDLLSQKLGTEVFHKYIASIITENQRELCSPWMLEMLTGERHEKEVTSEQATKEEALQHQSDIAYHGPSYTFFEEPPSPHSTSTESLSAQRTGDEVDDEGNIEEGSQEKILRTSK